MCVCSSAGADVFVVEDAVGVWCCLVVGVGVIVDVRCCMLLGVVCCCRLMSSWMLLVVVLVTVLFRRWRWCGRCYIQALPRGRSHRKADRIMLRSVEPVHFLWARLSVVNLEKADA